VKAAKQDIRKASMSDIQAYFDKHKMPSYRAKQVFSWIWEKGLTGFEGMTNVPVPLREKLAEDWLFLGPTVDVRQVSSDGTIKYRLKLHDGHLIEAVLIPVADDNRFTVCVSSQVGCSLSCAFCATGRMKRERNLEAAEIYDQVRIVNDDCLAIYGHPVTNIVYMGMGEPLLNYQEVLKSVEHITSPKGLGMSPRRITVSTAGIAKAIRRLADDKVKFNLALSLHAPIDEKRDKIMPINEQNNLAILMDAIEYFYQNTRGRISYEYIAFAGFNDSNQDALDLVKLCRRFPVKVNIIEYNPIPGLSFHKSNKEALDNFASLLSQNGVTVTVRRSRGKDIDAACGQLANRDR